MTCLNDFKFLSIEHVYAIYKRGEPVTYASGRERDGVSLFVLHIPDAILWKIDASWNKEKIDLAICNRVRKGEVGHVRG